RASPASTVKPTASRLSLGRLPGSPKHTGQHRVLGSPPKAVGQSQNSLVLVESSTWVSRPQTSSYSITEPPFAAGPPQALAAGGGFPSAPSDGPPGEAGRLQRAGR